MSMYKTAHHSTPNGISYYEMKYKGIHLCYDATYKDYVHLFKTDQESVTVDVTLRGNNCLKNALVLLKNLTK